MDRIRLQTDGASADVALRGAELRSWEVAGRSLLWSPDPAIWAETAPILFPVVGWTRNARIFVHGRSHPFGLHGFARERPFVVLEQEPARVRLELASSDDTRELYPFDWRLVVEYRLDGPTLVIAMQIHNTGATAMPYACGFHPGFRWPFAGGDPEDYAILFDRPERADVPVISADGLFTHDLRPVPLDGCRLPLSRALMAKEALCFLNVESRELRFSHASGAAITVHLEDFPHVALWSRTGGRFLSIEAWTGHGDYVDADGDLFRKPSMRHLPPGSVGRHAAKFSFATPEEL